jgi:hypothetical protein
MEKNYSIAGFILLTLGLTLGGWFIGDGFYKGRVADRYVTVKGLAERDVKADIALWPLRFVSTDDDLKNAQRKINDSHQKVMEFLKAHNIDLANAEVQKLEVTDVLANPYRSGPSTNRYIISQTIMVRSEDPENILATSQDVGKLVNQGVVLSSRSEWESGPTFLFTRLNEFKPAMIAEATANARTAAEQFAQDSGSKIGGIRRANQGVFVILPRDKAPGIIESDQIDKTIRVVATIDYLLED